MFVYGFVCVFVSAASGMIACVVVHVFVYISVVISGYVNLCVLVSFTCAAAGSFRFMCRSSVRVRFRVCVRVCFQLCVCSFAMPCCRRSRVRYGFMCVFVLVYVPV